MTCLVYWILKKNRKLTSLKTIRQVVHEARIIILCFFRPVNTVERLLYNIRVIVVKHSQGPVSLGCVSVVGTIQRKGDEFTVETKAEAPHRPAVILTACVDALFQIGH